MEILKEKKEKRKEIFLNAIIIMAVVGFGLLAINQTLEFFYHAHFLKSPCTLCASLNPNISVCLDARQNLYPDAFGGWASEINRINNLSNLAP